MVPAAQPVGKASANQAATFTTSTTALGSIPPANAVLAAIGVNTAMLPVLDKNVVITTLVIPKTVKTLRPLGFSPRIFNTKFPIASPAPEELRAEDIASMPAIIHTISLVMISTTSSRFIVFV